MKPFRLPHRLLAFACGMLLLAAGGCYQSTDITWHEPHRYKGAEDPLLAALQQGELQQRLEKRFRAVQTDR